MPPTQGRRVINRAMINQDDEKISKWANLGYDQGFKELKVSWTDHFLSFFLQQRLKKYTQRAAILKKPMTI